jgi:hypothetical protein
MGNSQQRRFHPSMKPLKPSSTNGEIHGFKPVGQGEGKRKVSGGPIQDPPDETFTSFFPSPYLTPDEGFTPP